MIDIIDVSNWSDHLEQVRHPSSSFPPPSDTRGRVRSAYFRLLNSADRDWNDDDGEGNSYLALAVLPPYARIQDIELAHNALGADHADNSVSIGVFGLDNSGFISRATTGANAVADDDEFFGEIDGAGEFDAAGTKRYGDTIATNYGYRTEKALLLVARVHINESAGIEDDTGEIRGFVRYVVD